MRLYKTTYTHKRTGKRRKGRTWRVRFSIDGRRYDVATGLTDKRAAQQRAGEIERDHQRAAAGLPVEECRTKDVPLETLVGEYEQELLRRKRSPAYISQTGVRLLKLFNGVPNLARLTPKAIQDRLHLVEEEFSAQTANQWRALAHGFFAWLLRLGRWTTNPVDRVPRARVKGPTFERRAMTREELDRLCATAPRYRALTYLLAATTGLRRRELRLLRTCDFDPKSGVLHVRPETAKNRREAWQPIHPDVARELAAWILETGLQPEQRLLRVPMAKTFNRDLVNAGIEKLLDGCKLDFHALRTTFGTDLVNAGVLPVDQARLMRHANIQTSYRYYSKPHLEKLQEMVDRLDVPHLPSTLPAGGPPASTPFHAEGKEKAGNAYPLVVARVAQ